MTSTSWPWLPVELVERIISEIWLMSLSATERLALLNSINLVNKTWMAIFAKVTSTDVRIPSPSSSDRLFRMMRGENVFYSRDSDSNPDNVCRSLGFTIDSSLMPDGVNIGNAFGTDKMGLAISNALHTIASFSYLTQLRRIYIEHHNWRPNDVFDHYRFSTFPAQVTDLELTFKGAESSLSTTVNSTWREEDAVKYHTPYFPSIRHLTIMGASPTFISDMVASCPNLESLNLETTCGLALLGRIPGNIRKITLQKPIAEIPEVHLAISVVATISAWLNSSDLIKRRLIISH